MRATERVTVSLSVELVGRIDRLTPNRSRFIAEAVERELARRGEDRILRPAHTGLGAWTADLPDDEGLVDVAGGTPVRWVEGSGWVRE